MGKSPSKAESKVLPILPLTSPSVLLPGVTLRVPITNRADVTAVLAKIYSRATTAKPDAIITVGCVPLNSTLVSKNGKLLLDERDGGAGTKGKAVYESDPVVAKNKDLFGFGCVAKVSGVQGRRQGELALVVEGLDRFRIEKILQERPYFEGMIEVVEDEGMWSLL
jgi:ATP-dependent Lon protease